MSDSTTDLLETLAIRGMLRGETTAEATDLVSQGMALDRAGTLVLTKEGHNRATESLRLEPDSESETALRPLYERFLLLNRSLREICGEWQTRPDGTANDHADAGYDARVRDQLEDVHERSLPLLHRMSSIVPSLGQYADGLQSALEALDAGDHSMLTAPLSASYHTVWMWWHQELLLRLGINRTDDELLEEKLVSEQRA